jgi:hypothetical protein
VNDPAIQIDDIKLDITVDIDFQRVKKDLIMQMTPYSNDTEIDDTTYEAMT